jgi:YVTN family beta-propeller protein
VSISTHPVALADVRFFLFASPSATCADPGRPNGAGETSEAGAAMLPFRFVLGVVVLGLPGALVGVVPDRVSAVPARPRCRPTAFVSNNGGGTVSAIDVKTRTKYPTDIKVGEQPAAMTLSPDGKTLFVANRFSNSVSTIDVKTRTKRGTDITVGSEPTVAAPTPDGKTLFVTNLGSSTVSTIDVKHATGRRAELSAAVSLAKAAGVRVEVAGRPAC